MHVHQICAVTGEVCFHSFILVAYVEELVKFLRNNDAGIFFFFYPAKFDTFLLAIFPV